jgi:hypothetical protein
MQNGRTFMTAFGRFATHRGWSGRRDQPDGIMFDLATGQDVLTGLYSPHHPRFFDGHWVICNSGTDEVIQVDPQTRETRRRLQLKSWTKGIEVGDDVFYVGEAAERHTGESPTSSTVAVVDRATWEVRDRIIVPAPDIYDLLWVPRALLRSVQQSLSVGPIRLEGEGAAGFVAVHEQSISGSYPLSPEDSQIRISADIPEPLKEGRLCFLDLSIVNLGSRELVSRQPNPVTMASRWLRRFDDAGDVVEGEHRLLPRPILPGEELHCRLAVIPPAGGELLLQITLVQEQVRWFDDVTPLNRWSQPVSVMPSS